MLDREDRQGVRMAAIFGKDSNSDCKSLSQRSALRIFCPRFPRTIRTFYSSFKASPVSLPFFFYLPQWLVVVVLNASPTERWNIWWRFRSWKSKEKCWGNLRIWVLLIRIANSSEVSKRSENLYKIFWRKFRGNADNVEKKIISEKNSYLIIFNIHCLDIPCVT